MTYEREYIIEESDTASHFGNDKVPVFASPKLLSWIEGTAIGTVAPFLPDGWETSGSNTCRHESTCGYRTDRSKRQTADIRCKSL